MKPSTWIAAIVASGALVGLGIAAGMSMAPKAQPSAGPALPMTVTSPMSGSAVTDLRVLNQVFVDLAAEVAPSVVEVRPFGQGGSNPMSGGGSGFVYTSDGWIVTNDHVTGGAKKVTIVMHDGKEYEGTVYSPNDRMLDLALVKIEAKDLKPLPLADSGEVKPGQFAMAIGSPFGYESTVTVGHVSAVNRPGAVRDPRTGEPRVYEGMIQTDAAINPGNSGGPLLDIYGRVIGVNSTISSTTGGSNGIGFSLPANTVKVVAEELRQTKKFDRGFLGVNFAPALKPYELKELGIEGGARVLRAFNDGAAYKAGMREQDVITKIDNEKIDNPNDLLIAMYRRSPGDQVEVTYRRGSENKRAKLTLTGTTPEMQDLLDEDQPRSMPRGGPGIDPEEFFRGGVPDFFRTPRSEGDRQPERQFGPVRLGVTIEGLTPENRKQFGVPASAQGVVVTSIGSGTLGEQAGLEVGAVLQEINGQKITSPDQVGRALQSAQRGGTLRLKHVVWENGQPSVRTSVVRP